MRRKLSLWSTKSESSELNDSSSSGVHLQQVRAIEIDGRGEIWSVSFLVDHIVSGGKEGKIRCWRMEDVKEEGTPMNAGSAVSSIAVSRDGKWIVSGTIGGLLTVWAAKSHKKLTEFRGHSDSVRAVDISPDGTRIATGSYDSTACVWSLETGQRLLRPLKHDAGVIAVKFSGSNELIATATFDHNSIRIYDSQNGQLLVDVPIKVNSSLNQSLAWASDSKELFALSHDGDIISLDVSTRTIRSKWPIHSSDRPTCITLASDGTFLAASANSSISLWNVTTHQRIGQLIQDNHFVQSMAISTNHRLATGGGKTISIHSLCDIPPSPCCDDMLREEESPLPTSETPDPERARESLHMVPDEDPNEKIENLEQRVQELGHELATSKRVNEELNETIDSLRVDLRVQEECSNNKIAQLAETVQKYCAQLVDSEHRADILVQIICAHEQRHQCEALYAGGRIIDAAASLLNLANTVSEEARANKSIIGWLLEFTRRCVSELEIIGDEASSSENHDEAVVAYSAALSLCPSTPDTLLIKWASSVLIRGSANEALGAAAKFKLPVFIIYQAICDVLEGEDRVAEATECFRQMRSEPSQDTRQWELDFRGRCVEKLEKLGDTAMDSRHHDTAIQQYSDALTLDPSNQIDILLKRSKAQSLMGSWKEALNDADKVIELDPSSYKGYERKHAALQGMGRHSEAFAIFEMMVSKLKQSSDPRINELRPRYFDATSTIRSVVNQTIRHMPRVLIDTTTGRLYDKTQQAAAFEKLPIYDEMRSSMTTRLDPSRISSEVKQYYRYVMFSHRWEDDEPLFQKVENISIYELEKSSQNVKLQVLCALVRSLGFQWVWSDTCCIDKKDSVVLQESLVAMFTWYRGSSLTIVYLLGVWSQSQKPGDLRGSIWNTRAWTYQEYVAAEYVQFYTEDWKPYLGLDMFNHKESPAIISEMQQVVGGFTQELAVHRPGLERVREKLYLASMRQTTLAEDTAYSLLGILNAAIPVIYGEGDRAVGRLLEHILTGSGDVTILAWTGRSGSYNSCLPVDLTVYHQLVPPHIPQPIGVDEMGTMVTTLRSSLPDLSQAVMLYSRLSELPPPSLAASRLRLPAIIFRLTELVHISGPDPVTNLHVYHATTYTFGDIEIKTVDNLTGMEDLCLVHPWIRPLLDQEFSHRTLLDKTTQALRFVARLRQPFGVLLFEPLSWIEYRRVAADSLIITQVREEVSLIDFIDNIRLIEVQ